MSERKKSEQILYQLYENCEQNHTNRFYTMYDAIVNIDYPVNSEISKEDVQSFRLKHSDVEGYSDVECKQHMKLGIFLDRLKKRTKSFLITVLSKTKELSEESSSGESSSEESSGESSLEESSGESSESPFQKVVQLLRLTSLETIPISERKELYQLCDDTTMFIRNQMKWVQSTEYHEKKKGMEIVDMMCPGETSHFEVNHGQRYYVKGGRKYKVLKAIDPRKAKKQKRAIYE